MTTIARNPVMPGFYPDPSICARRQASLTMDGWWQKRFSARMVQIRYLQG